MIRRGPHNSPKPDDPSTLPAWAPKGLNDEPLIEPIRSRTTLGSRLGQRGSSVLLPVERGLIRSNGRSSDKPTYMGVERLASLK